MFETPKFLDDYAEQWHVGSSSEAILRIAGPVSPGTFFEGGQQQADELILPSIKPHFVVGDLGCGIGRHARHVSKHCSRLVAMDVSQSMLSCMGVAGQNVVPQLLTGPELPLEDESMNFIYSIDLMGHIEFQDAVRLLRSCYRALKTGGRLLVTAPNMFHDYYHDAYFGLNSGTPYRLYPWTAEMMWLTLRRVGFMSSEPNDNRERPEITFLAQKPETVVVGVDNVKVTLDLSEVPKAPAILTSVPKADAGDIVKYYRDGIADVAVRKPLAPLSDEFTLINHPHGLGDCMVMTPIPEAASQEGRNVTIYSGSGYFLELMKFNPHFSRSSHALCVSAAELNVEYEVGNGHFIQRLHRAFGLKVPLRPKGYLATPQIKKPKRVIMHFEAGHHAYWQRDNIHPRARQVYKENLDILEKFIARHQELEFIEVGRGRACLYDVMFHRALSLTQLIELMSTAELFIGIISGPMHNATALGLDVINIINFPDANKIMLPTLVASTLVESEWLYPQNIHLHQDNDGPLVRQFSADMLERAYNKELYPYGSEEYLSLIHEKL